MTISTAATTTIKSSLDGVTSNPDSGIPGLVFVAVGKDGKTLVEHASGKKGKMADDGDMTLDTTFWVASCTKMITGVACMQLVEQGKLSLDDPQSLYKLCPELEKIKVLEDGKLVARKGDITLRMLLSHTAGFGYEFFDPRLVEFGEQQGKGFNALNADVDDYLRMPLVNQPGSTWEYGVRAPFLALPTLPIFTRTNSVRLVNSHSQTDQHRLGWHNGGACKRTLPRRIFSEKHLGPLGPEKHLVLPQQGHEVRYSDHAATCPRRKNEREGAPLPPRRGRRDGGGKEGHLQLRRRRMLRQTHGVRADPRRAAERRCQPHHAQSYPEERDCGFDV
jgi:hypothetical protein